MPTDFHSIYSHGFIRAAVCLPHVRVADPEFNSRRTLALAQRASDANAVLAHFKGPAVQQFVPKLLESSSISSFEVYGDPGPEVTKMVAAFKAEIFLPRHGVSR